MPINKNIIIKEVKKKTLYEEGRFPHVRITSEGNKLHIRFDSEYGSFGQIVTVVVKFDRKENQYSLLDKNQSG